MKVFAVLLLVCVAGAAARPLADNEYEFLFGRFMKQFDKFYEDADEFFQRFHVFKDNVDAIMDHMAKPERTFDMRMNEYGDMTNDEFTSKFNNYVPSGDRRTNVRNISSANLPASVDWVTAGKVTAVKNQGQCGSCWAFSTTGSTESAIAIKNGGSPQSLSEQELVDCSGSYGNEGCNGGEMQAAFKYIIAHGDCSESAYPYTATDGTCKSSQCTSVATLTAFTNVPQNDESSLQAAVAQQPVSVAVDASGLGWQFYGGGILSSSCGTQLDHGVLAAGYGSDGGSDYWLVKNSWGATWGESGYIRLARGTGSGKPGECGIAMDPSYPTA